MSETRTKIESAKSRATKDGHGTSFPLPHLPRFELPNVELPYGFRAAAVQWVDQGKKNFDAMISAAAETCGTCGNTWSTAARRTAGCMARLAEAMQKNVDVAFEVAHDLMDAKSLPEHIEISTAGARRQFETLALQNRELWSMAQEAAAETMRPLTAAIPKTFEVPAASWKYR
jgi:hypothetical protein